MCRPSHLIVDPCEGKESRAAQVDYFIYAGTMVSVSGGSEAYTASNLTQRARTEQADSRTSLAAAIIDFFSAEPLRSAGIDQIALALGTEGASTASALDGLSEIGVLRRTPSPSGPHAFQLTVADGFLDTLERLTAFYSEQLNNVTISPERALLTTGELAAEETPSSGLRALRARVASLESANTMLMRKNLELSFLFESSAQLASSIDPATLVQITLEAVGIASRLRAKRYFVALTGEEGLIFYGGVGLDRRDAEQFIERHRALLNDAVELGEVTCAPDGAITVLPLSSLPTAKAQGCIVIAEMESQRLNGDELRALISLSELAGRGFANAALFSQSVALGVTDELTGVMNRRYLFARLGEEIKRARRLNLPLSLIILDLDFFKSVNDQHGHQEGDRVLRVVAQTILASVRDIDIVTRFGGEEFAIILPGADARNGFIIAERIRDAVGATRLRSARGAELLATVSCGIAPLGDGARSTPQLIAEADRYLLQAKRGGRNRTVSPIR
ncbi:MAG: GGDEF domain-containing protein [Candidatus Eremiobacteraeota bacterium]|nr:GGDEF domain-containing protein [Candidatus Eremiobacteraeota bacterium]